MSIHFTAHKYLTEQRKIAGTKWRENITNIFNIVNNQINSYIYLGITTHNTLHAYEPSPSDIILGLSERSFPKLASRSFVHSFMEKS
jgi:hypothetical protein